MSEGDGRRENLERDAEATAARTHANVDNALRIGPSRFSSYSNAVLTLDEILSGKDGPYPVKWV